MFRGHYHAFLLYAINICRFAALFAIGIHAEGRLAIARRFSPGKSGVKVSSPGGTTEFSRTFLRAALAGLQDFLRSLFSRAAEDRQQYGV